MRIRFSLAIRDIKNIVSAAEVIFLVFLAEYAAAEAAAFHIGQLYRGDNMNGNGVI